MILCSSLVFAGESTDIDFSELRTHAVFLYEGDEVRFSLLEGNHSVIIEDVGTASIKIDVVAFLDSSRGSTPWWLGFSYACCFCLE